MEINIKANTLKDCHMVKEFTKPYIFKNPMEGHINNL